jgi:hypothetical protein
LAARRQLVGAFRRRPRWLGLPSARDDLCRSPDTPPGSRKPSERPFETIKPLADRLGIDPKPIKTFAKGQEQQLADKLVSLDGVAVLVSWEQEAIVGKLLPAIVRGHTLPEMPKTWDGARFDVVLRFDRAAPGAP